MRIVLLIALIMSVSAFAPPPPDQRVVELCNLTGGIVNETVFDPDTTSPKPGLDRAPVTVVNCLCPKNSVWNSVAGCEISTTTIEPVPLPEPSKSLIEKIIDFIKDLFWFLG